MDWHAELITLYLEVCRHWEEAGWAQRHGPYAELAGSMPLILARQGRRFNAKVAPKLTGSGYCPTKNF
ncbi:hypothetical protein GPROT1_02765 [Gammaproteobacteria bacterium]|nr:hypothetical protein GPROT1_02765 [Gammaproteobacteria bacterium]